MKSFFKKLLFWVAILIVAVVAFLLFWKVVVPQISGIFAASSNYQAVFLDNGQVYFGRLSKVNSNFIYLKDVFYIQSDAQSKNPVLVELGTTETHKPQNHLQINREKVTMVQDLMNDSPVVKAIKDYRANQ